MTNFKLNKDSIINILIGLFILVTYVFGLLVPITSDAGKYAAISRVIYETGDWINLKIHFEPYLQKPPLLFWITTPFYFIFGPTVFAFKFPVLLYSGIAIFSTYKFARVYYEKNIAQFAALVLATCEFYFLFHSDIHTDCLLTANVIFAMWHLAEYFKSKKLLNILLAGLGIGLALISKGPIGIFVPVTAALTHLILTKQFKQIFNYKIVLGALVALAVLAAGLTGIYNQFGWEGLQFFFWENNVGRISGAIKGGHTDYFFYFHTALYIFLPWGFIFFVALFFEIKEIIKLKNKEFFSFGAIFFYWIVISAAKAQAPHYLMVLSPFMAIITAKWLVRFFSEERFIKLQKTVYIIQYFVIALIFALLLLMCIRFFPSQSFIFWGVEILLIILLLIKSRQSKLSKIVRKSVIAIIAINLALNAHLFPQMFQYQSVIPACKNFNSEANEGETLNTYLSEHRELFFYAKNPGYFLYESEDLLECLKNPNEWIYTNDKGLEEIQQTNAEIEIKESFKHRSISKLSGTYLNPATREKSLRNMHLVKIIKPLE